MESIPVELDDHYFSLASELADTVCLARNTQGYACGLEPGHDGWHRADLDHGEIETWPSYENLDR